MLRPVSIVVSETPRCDKPIIVLRIHATFYAPEAGVTEFLCNFADTRRTGGRCCPPPEQKFITNDIMTEDNINDFPYNDYGRWIRSRFPFRVQKISVDAGFSCPNRDGRIGRGGCIYCDNRTFNPSYCGGAKTIRQQIEEGKTFFARKYSDMKYIAYFQAYTNTYASVEILKGMYEEALATDGVVGLAIGTRPDCMPDELLDYLEELNRRTFLIVEYGIETANDETLRRINRGHSFLCARQTVERTAARGILTGGHIILGLPGEDARESIRQAAVISSLPLDMLKIHQMQVIRGTRLAEMYGREPFHVYTVDEYISLVCEYIQHLRPDLVLERFVSQAPKDMLVAPQWGLKNHEFTNLLVNRMKRDGIRQGAKLTAG